MAEPLNRPPLRRPVRCVMVHTYVEEPTQLRMAASAALIGRAPEQLAGFVLDRVFGDPNLQRLLKI